MQVLKDEIREKILQAAKEEFRYNGYEKTSMRQIAKGAHISVGNLYRYYLNKEQLFEAVVDTPFNEIVYFIKNNKALSMIDNLRDYKNFKIQFKILAKLFYKYKNEFLIIIYGSNGTKYRDSKEKIIELVEEKIRKALKIKKGKNINEKNYLSHVISVSLVEGLISIIKELEDDNKIKQMVEQYIRFMFKGFKLRFNL